jgi:hypothetical protein
MLIRKLVEEFSLLLKIDGYFFRETQTIAVHKDSQWFQSWQSFKDNNTYLNSSYY